MEKLPNDKREAMSRELSKSKSVLMMAALLTASLGMVGDTIITPGADAMFKYYNHDSFVNFLLSGPNLISMFASIAAGFAMKYVDKKKMLLFGMILFVAGGALGSAVDSEAYMMFMRCLVGVALGFTNVTAMTIVTVMYADENRRSRMVGILDGGMFCAATIMTALSGFVVQNFGFKAVFYIYALGIISVLMIIFFIPKSPPEKDAEETSEEDNGSFENKPLIKNWKSKFVILCIGYFIFQTLYAITALFISVYTAEKELGGAAFAGTITSTLFIGAFVASILFGFLYPKLKRSTMLISFGCVVIGYGILIFVPKTIPVVIACLLFGYSNANGLSQAMTRAGILAPAKNASLAISIIAAVMGVGFFISTYTVSALKAVMKTDLFIEILPVLFICALVLLAAGIIYLFATRNSEAGKAGKQK
ncbi:MAG: MFS transporter [Anaerovoracaceae bacterium]